MFFVSSISSKKTNKNTSHCSKNEFIHSFIGRIHGFLTFMLLNLPFCFGWELSCVLLLVNIWKLVSLCLHFVRLLSLFNIGISLPLHNVPVSSEFMGKTFQAAQLTHERFLTIDHSCKIFFWYLSNWTSTDLLWCVVLFMWLLVVQLETFSP